MITDAILNFFAVLANTILSPLSIIDVGVDLITSIPVVTKFILFVAYVIPWDNLVPLFAIVLALIGLRIGISLVKFIITFVPWF